jgi:hypothetical protein
MRQIADADRIRRFMRALAAEADTGARVYLTGGATAVLLGWRDSTIDVDIKLVPETDRLFRALPSIKERLQINVELASPGDFIPVHPAWADRSTFIEQDGPLGFYHFDLYAQALAKIERSHQQDLEDVRAMVARGLVEPRRAWEYFAAIEANLYRYPALDPRSFREAIKAVLGPES